MGECSLMHVPESQGDRVGSTPPKPQKLTWVQSHLFLFDTFLKVRVE